jgi:hypothetical protein
MSDRSDLGGPTEIRPFQERPKERFRADQFGMKRAQAGPIVLKRSSACPATTRCSATALIIETISAARAVPGHFPELSCLGEEEGPSR